MWRKAMQFIRRLLSRKDAPAPPPPPAAVPAHDRNEIVHLKTYERELQHRMRAIDLDMDILGRRPRE